ncbi:hypothetical protein L1987_39389 [Smallanthus sonchifolius]|uniref:Uncharacterized protein n=1 Tax=Smallanthus sonchifolius TaxID=185202 RepID=A0ACB9HLW9_9ASTR|nr:hypothetical protein L1987_39389 [Smallanthus sonchifolius]
MVEEQNSFGQNAGGRQKAATRGSWDEVDGSCYANLYAKERKQEILRLKRDLIEVEDGIHHELLPGSASCKCYFFDKLGELSPNKLSGEGFDERFMDMLCRRFLRQDLFLIQLIEFLVTDYLTSWSKTNGFATELFGEWATSILHARKGLQLLESRCGLYIIYMDRVIGLIAKLVGQAESLQKLNPNILQSILNSHEFCIESLADPSNSLSSD